MKVFPKVLLRVFAYSSALLVLLLLAGVFYFVFFEQTVPDFILRRVMDCCSTSDLLVRADSATFSFDRGLRVKNVRAFDKGRLYGEKDGPATVVLTASEVDLELDLRRIPWSSATILRAVTIVDLSYPRLPRGYYVPDSVEFPGRPDYQEVDQPLELDLPELRPFRVRLVRPSILGIESPLVEAQSVEVTTDGLVAKGISLRWPDTDVVMEATGNVMLDLRGQLLHGEVRGQARQHNIRPMLVALDITNSYQFVDAFTKVEKPVDTSCRFDVDLRKNDLRILLDLHPRGGCHHGVPLRKVDGKVDIRVFVRDTYQNARIVVGPLLGTLADGSAVEGTILYENTNDVGFVNFDVGTRAPLKDVLAIADVWNDGTLDCLSITRGTPLMSLRGRLAVEDAHAATNDLRGTLAFEEGALWDIPLRDVSTEFRVQGTTVSFTNVVARSAHGGQLGGVGVISVPESRRELATYKVRVNGDSLPLEDVAHALNFDPGDKTGVVSGFMDLSGPLLSETNVIARFVGGGRLECKDGRLAQMRLFAGLTDYLAKRVPGIADVVNLSRASLDYTLRDGVFSSTNVVVEGNVLSVHAEGRYDAVNDNLDFRARVSLTKNESFFAKLATPITWPFSNLARVLLDFGIHGPLDNPTWVYGRNPFGLLPLGK